MEKMVPLFVTDTGILTAEIRPVRISVNHHISRKNFRLIFFTVSVLSISYKI
jgi:hypothetical protein